MSKLETAGVGSAAGAALGGLIGGLVGGQKGAAIGIAAGLVAGGALGFLIASDAFSQTSQQTAQELENSMSAKTDYVNTQDIVLKNGQKAKQINLAKFTIPKDKMEYEGKLSDNGKKTLQKLRSEYRKTGGSIAVVCPTTAPKTVEQTIKNLNIYVKKNNAITDYELYASRDAKQKVVLFSNPWLNSLKTGLI